MIFSREFEKFPKIPRLNRDMVITEKIDGTNAGIFIAENGIDFLIASRTRWITSEDDNYGFARWCKENMETLYDLGPGMHWGEWWGQGIQRRYGINEKRFSLFNTGRWGQTEPPPDCCHVVPVLYRGPFSLMTASAVIDELSQDGSAAAPGFDNPEGIIIYHEALRDSFKWTIINDEKPKGSKE